ncbi:hypothetical protein LT980_22295 [Citrobacter portucalensis]|uniref:hypothetical protein n=1 Tax=Citrobacter portucalensis TaxID=1639133 RepID=UPI00202CC175|nr:hypothetical protein [Citrobacter portucalensis]URR12589.1 hypothetical protein LT980_22295 [Citrobacter portucalensis]
MNEDEKCSKNKLYGPVLVLMEKIPVGDVFKKIICALIDFNYIYGRHYPEIPYWRVCAYFESMPLH